MRVNLGRIACRFIRQASSSQYTRVIILLTIALCVHYAHAVDETSPEYTKLLNVEIWDGVHSAIC
jgi:hypothetical protein